VLVNLSGLTMAAASVETVIGSLAFVSLGISSLLSMAAECLEPLYAVLSFHAMAASLEHALDDAFQLTVHG